MGLLSILCVQTIYEHQKQQRETLKEDENGSLTPSICHWIPETLMWQTLATQILLSEPKYTGSLHTKAMIPFKTIKAQGNAGIYHMPDVVVDVLCMHSLQLLRSKKKQDPKKLVTHQTSRIFKRWSLALIQLTGSSLKAFSHSSH